MRHANDLVNDIIGKVKKRKRGKKKKIRFRQFIKSDGNDIRSANNAQRDERERERENGHASKFALLIVAISTTDEFRWQWKRMAILLSSYLIGGTVIGSANYDRWGYWPRDRSHNVLSCYAEVRACRTKAEAWFHGFRRNETVRSPQFRRRGGGQRDIALLLSRTSIFLPHFAWKLHCWNKFHAVYRHISCSY